MRSGFLYICSRFTAYITAGYHTWLYVECMMTEMNSHIYGCTTPASKLNAQRMIPSFSLQRLLENRSGDLLSVAGYTVIVPFRGVGICLCFLPAGSRTEVWFGTAIITECSSSTDRKETGSSMVGCSSFSSSRISSRSSVTPEKACGFVRRKPVLVPSTVISMSLLI